MLTILHNPLDTLFEAIYRIKPDIEAEIQFVDDLKDHVGETIFPDETEQNKTPLINIAGNIPFHAVIEIIAHEAAHVMAGVDHEHDEVWQYYFDRIHEEYIKVMEEKFANHSKGR